MRGIKLQACRKSESNGLHFDVFLVCSLCYHNIGMASKSSFTDFCDPLIEAIAVDWFAVSILSVLLMFPEYIPRDSDFFDLQNEPRYQDIFVPSQSLQISPCSPSESFSTLFLETPPDQPFTSGVLQDILYSLHIPHETSISQPRTAATPPYNAVRNRVPFSSLNPRY